MNFVALIPARSGSKRIKDKNIKELAGKPLLAWSIVVAIKSELFKNVVVSSDSEQYLEIAKSYGAETILTPVNNPIIHQDKSNDFPWVEHALIELKKQGKEYDAFCILRPTNPFRNVDMIKRAISKFEKLSGLNYLRTDFSMRAVENCKQHPCKMWTLHGSKIIPLFGSPEMKLFTQPYQQLPPVYAQNASLEIAFTQTVFDRKSHTETTIYPFWTQGIEGLDINTEEDFLYAQMMIEKVKRKI